MSTNERSKPAGEDATPRPIELDELEGRRQKGLARPASARRFRLRLSQPIKGFVLETEDGLELVCREVRGFREAMLAAYDPRAPMPSRLVLVLPDVEMGAWLASWSEDTDRIRRTLAIRRLFDGRQVTAVATLACYGFGIDTSLGIESIAAEPAGTAFRSGVHGRGSAGLEA